MSRRHDTIFCWKHRMNVLLTNLHYRISRRVQSMKINHQESNRSINCNRWQLVNCYRLVSDNRWPIDSHNKILPPPSIGGHIGCSQALPVESFGPFHSVVTGSQVVSRKKLKSTWWYTIVSRVIPPSRFVSLSQAGEHTRQTWLSTKLQEWCCEYPSLMGSCRPSNYLHSTPPRQHTVAYEIEAAWSSVFQNRFQSMTIDGVHFIDHNR